MGRPTKNADRRRSRQVIFRLTDAEYSRLCDKATLAGLPPNELARRLTKKGKRKLIVKTTGRVDPAFLKRIDAIGRNLNQLVKKAHILGQIDPQIVTLCTTIDDLVNQVIADEIDDS